MALPPREQRYRFLRYEGLEYTDSDIEDFESRLERIYTREIYRVHVVDFQSMPELLRDELFARMAMEHRDEAVLVRWSQEAPELEAVYSGLRITHRGGDGRDILTGGDFLGPPPSYTLIKDPVLRLCHRMMAHSIAGRSQTPEKVTVTDLFYLRGMDVGSVNIPYLLARYLRRVRLQICVQLDDTWAWVAMGPERQPDAAAGTPANAEDTLIVDEGDQAIPEP
ncbi:hypothetical protein Tco_1325927, partial [Tanacetum coccineum]